MADNSNNMNSNVNQMQQEVKKGQAPDTVSRVDQASLHPGDRYAHVHFKDGAALRDDGTWKHGGRNLSREEKKWLDKWGWTHP
ncbi:unnamed protein product [Adineta steineri]|uniref:Uncharacterized protein n=1 Tax=Adineta steineri TaxID=433720 RepID=A0A819Q5B6_9BILA|nr:unnamed protein product [Adineta steineri]CAF0951703.1 unnamed protein product [Adineta steineri]CAF4001588.1 unnamed protein product [Adineta steineri]CAF4023218.1 unnamed protein product [Adineta steineri]